MTKLTGMLTCLLTALGLAFAALFSGCYSRTSASGFDCSIALGNAAEKVTSSNFPSDASSHATPAPVPASTEARNERTATQ